MTPVRQQQIASVVAVAGAVVLLSVFIITAGLLFWSDLSADERHAASALLQGRIGFVLIAAGVVMAFAGATVQPLVRRWVFATARLQEQARVLVTAGVQRQLSAAAGAAPVRALARTINELAAQRDQLRGDIAAEVARASHGVEQERNRLAALMSELTQSVVVCNLEGRVLLYNNRARLQFRALSEAPTLAGGSELIGLGRSIYTVFDRRLIAHALDNLRQGLQLGAAHPTTQFVTSTRTGQLLRVQMAPVPGGPAAQDAAGAAAAPTVGGFVLMLDNITRDFEQESARERQIHALTEDSRGLLGRLLTAVEGLGNDALEAAQRERLLGIVREESRAVGRRINEFASEHAKALASRWPLQEMAGEDLLQIAQRRIESAADGLRCNAAAGDTALWLRLDSFSLLQALAYLAQRLHEEYEIPTLQVRLAAADERRVHLDLVWSGQVMSTETVMGWELDAIATDAGTSQLSVRDVVQRHGGEFWFERDRVRHQAFFRFLLPRALGVAAEGEAAAGAIESRPEYYDFDLFAVGASQHALDDRPLSELAFTVFDTETTGLDPTGGDQIIQIGATRLVNGKLLKGESFDQLVNPQRPIPPAGVPIHGITQDMVAGKPTIAQVLPAFHAYAEDTVLVAHNAAFDMRFLQLQEAAAGVRFEQPVLDTLLLSAVVHPQQESHRLEAIAERFGVNVIGRHTALGDALVTAEVFQKLLPLLAEQGIHTLKQARDAAQKTYFARVKY